MQTTQMPTHPYLRRLPRSSTFVPSTDDASSGGSAQGSGNESAAWDEDQQSPAVSVPCAMKMLPPAEQYSSLAQTLLDEIAAHGVTRANLEHELQRRTDAQTNLFHELANWIDAYNGCFASLHEHADENARLQKEVHNLESQMELMESQMELMESQIHPAHRFTLDPSAPKNRKLRVQRKKLMRCNSDARSEDRRRGQVVEDGRVGEAAESYETGSMCSADE